MEEIETILINKRDNLKEQLNSTKRELEVINLIKAFDFEITKPSGKVFYDIKVSPEAINEFISLLKPDEYVQGFEIKRCYRVDSEQFTKHTDKFLMLFNNEYLLNFTYEITKYNDYDDEYLSWHNLKKRTEIGASCYYDEIKDLYFARSHDYLQDYKKIVNILRVIYSRNGDLSKNKLIGTNSLGYSLFGGEVTTLYNVSDNLPFRSETKVKDDLTSISSEILMERYLEKFQKQNGNSRVRK